MRARIGACTLACLAAGSAAAQLPPGEWNYRLEMKREQTARGSPGESTKTTLRTEAFFDAPVALLRLDLLFPDDKTDMTGSPFDPRQGDTKLRAGFRPLRTGRLRFPSFVEVTFPTADPATLGTGKYQLALGIRMLAPFEMPFGGAAAHAPRFEAEVEQVTSFGGDAERADINYTKLELTLYDLWREKYTLKLKLKPSFDHVKHADGAVGEAEAGLFFARAWRTWLMAGRRLWGPQGLSGTYDDRIEIGLQRAF